MAQTHTSSSSHHARNIVGLALLLESSQLRHSTDDHYLRRIEQHQADQDLLRLLMATTLCGFGLLILAVLH